LGCLVGVVWRDWLGGGNIRAKRPCFAVVGLVGVLAWAVGGALVLVA